MKVPFKIKDWMAICIGALAVLLAAGGVLMPDWVKDHHLTTWEEYAILVLLVLLTIICLLVLQRSLRREEAEREAQASKDRADQDDRNTKAEAREAAARERERARDKREDDRDIRFSEFLALILFQMTVQGQEDTALFTSVLDVKEGYDRAINERKRELREELALRTGNLGRRDEMVRHGGYPTDLSYISTMAPPIGTKFASVDDLRDRADEKLRLLLARFKPTDN